MIAALLLSLAAAAAPSPRLLVMDPQTGDDSAFAAADVLALQRLLIAELGRAEGVVVVAASDVAQLAELGSKQQLAGCETDACLAEIAGAIGAELLVISELAQLGSRSIWQLALFDQKQGAILSRATIKADDIDGLADSLENAIAELLEPLAARGIVVAEHGDGGGLFVASAVVAGAGAVVGVVGALGGSAVVFGDPTYSTELRRAVVGVVGMGASVLMEWRGKTGS